MHHSHPSNGGPPPPPLPPPPLGPPMPPHGVYGAHPHIHPPPHGHMPPPPPPPPQSHPGMDQRPKDGIPYIGSRISLISKTDIRYEGFLYNIDTRQSMVALQHVRSFGTEGRRPEHIPPSDQVLPYATFKASEIKDLHVCEAAPSPMYGGGGYAPPMPPPPSMAHGQGPPPMQPYQQFQPPVPTPAPVQTSVPSSPPQKTQEPVVPSSPAQKPITTHSLLTPGSVSNAKQSVTTKPTSPVHTIKQKTPISSPVLQPESPKRSTSSTPSTGNNGNTTRGRTIPGMGGHLLKRKERRVPNGEGTTTVSSGSDFNFETGLNDFDKEEEFSKLSLSEVKETKGTYQKSSFFDTISCDALDRLEGKLGRVTASEERKLNSETFGAVGLNNRRSFRGGRGGNGGNRRGRGRGRGNSGEGNSRSGGSSRNRGGGNAWYQNSGNETRA